MESHCVILLYPVHLAKIKSVGFILVITVFHGVKSVEQCIMLVPLFMDIHIVSTF